MDLGRDGQAFGGRQAGAGPGLGRGGGPGQAGEEIGQGHFLGGHGRLGHGQPGQGSGPGQDEIAQGFQVGPHAVVVGFQACGEFAQEKQLGHAAQAFGRGPGQGVAGAQARAGRGMAGRSQPALQARTSLGGHLDKPFAVAEIGLGEDFTQDFIKIGHLVQGRLGPQHEFGHRSVRAGVHNSGHHGLAGDAAGLGRDAPGQGHGVETRRAQFQQRPAKQRNQRNKAVGQAG